MSAADSIGRVLDTVDYLRVTSGATERDDWWSCEALTADPDTLLGLVRSTAPDRGTDRDDVALSLFVQGYAFRVASIALGCWLLDDVVLDVGPGNTSVALGRNRPNALHLDDARLVETDDSLATLHATLVEGHLTEIVDNARRACRIGEALLWSNIGAACASSFGAFMVPRPDLHTTIRDRFEAFLAAGRPELAASGRIVHVGPVWAWERSACCLYVKTESGFMCEDCSLRPDEERQERYTRVLASIEE